MTNALRLTVPSPNSVSRNGALSFEVKDADWATVTHYSVLGQEVETLCDRTAPGVGSKWLRVEADDLTSAVDVVRLQANGQRRRQRLTVVR